jgi:trans-aconitate methyltransferase
MNAKNPPYTAQSCREEAAINDKFGDPIMNDPDLLRAHADSLEENARLRAERDTHVAVTERIKVALRIRGTGSYVEWAAHCRDALDKLERAEAELTKLKDEQARAAKIFADALMQWSVEKTELQAELAKLLKSVQEFWEEKP